MSWTLIGAFGFPVTGQVAIARPNAVGGALRSGKGSCSSSGSGSGSGGGGVDSLLFLVGYFRGSGGGAGKASSFVSADFPSVKRSNALVVFLVSLSTDGSAAPCLIASAFFLRSSASFASLLEPPRSLGAGRSGWEGTRSPVVLLGTLLQETFANHPPAGGEI
jgi:hypothetical protein